MTRQWRYPRVGVALAQDRCVAVLPGGRVLETGDTGDLRQLFTDLRTRAQLSRAVVNVALVAPLADLRILSLPPLREGERQRVVERDARRYFVRLAQPVTIGTQRVGPCVLAAAASEALVTEIEQAAQQDGWSLGVVVPAAMAWSAGIRRTSPDRGMGHVVARLPQSTEVLRLERGVVVERRQFRAGETDGGEITKLVADSKAENCLTTLTEKEQEPLAFAARHARSAAGPELMSTSRRTRRRGLVRRVTTGMGVAAAGCLLLAGVLDYWGLSHQVAAIRARRASIGRGVASAMVAQDSLGRLTEGLLKLQQLEVTAPRWSMFIAGLADYLPRDAHLMALRAVGDSVVIEGVAARAVGAFHGLQLMPGVAGVRAVAPIRQDAAADGTVREQFAIAVWLQTGSVP